MATEPTSSTRTRRAVLGAALGGAAAVAAQSIAPLAAKATQGDTVLAGSTVTATDVTSLENTTAAGISLEGLHSGTGTGVVGSSVDGSGLVGASTDAVPSTWADATSRRTGVFGTSGDSSGVTFSTDETGVFGHCGTSDSSNGVWGDSATGTGVYATGYWGLYGSGAAAVVGDTGTTGVGVYGWTGTSYPTVPPRGVGVYAAAQTTAQTALSVSGKVKFSRSARKSMGGTATSVKVTLAGVTTASYVIATLQTSVSGVYVRAVVPASGYFTIYLSKAAGKTVVVGYMVIN